MFLLLGGGAQKSFLRNWRKFREEQQKTQAISALLSWGLKQRRAFQGNEGRSYSYLIENNVEITKNATSFCSSEKGFETATSNPTQRSRNLLRLSLFLLHKGGYYFRSHPKARKLVMFLTVLIIRNCFQDFSQHEKNIKFRSILQSGILG